MDIVTLGAALNGSAEYVNSHFKGGSNIQIVDNPDGTQTINASGEVSAEDTVARAEIAEMKDGETLDSFSDVETALDDKADSTTTYTKTEVDTALGNKADKSTTYTKTEVDTALGNKADKSTTYTKTEVDTALGNKVDKVSGKGLSTNDYTDVEKTKLAGIAEGAEVNEIESIKVNNTTVNPDANKVVNITVPTTAADVSALPDTTKYAVALSLTINSSTFVMTGQLKDQNGDNLGTAQTIDLPLESVVVGGSYNSQTKKVVLTLQNGNTIEFSVADLVAGLQTELSESNKLNPAYIAYDSTHRAVSDTEKSAWNSKQNAIDSSHKLSADLVDDTNATNKFATADELEQIQTNKNNILLLEQANGAKNVLNISTIEKSNNITTALNSDKSITISVTSANARSYIYINGNSYIPNEYANYIFVCDNGGNQNINSGVTYSNNGASWANESFNNTGAPIEINSNYPYLRFSLYFEANTIITNATVKIMLLPKSLYNAGFTDYQPYALSNAELTAAIQALQAQLANQ